MRFRSRSVRAKIIALLLVPLASLTGLWAYTTASSLNQAWGLTRISSDAQWFGDAADELSLALQDERRAAVAFSAAPAGRGDLGALHRAEAATDQSAAVVRAHLTDGARLGDLNASQDLAVSGVLTQIDTLQASRAKVEARQMTWDDVYLYYCDAQSPFFTLRLQLSDLQTGILTREAGDLVELVRAREYISREDALMTGAQAAGRFTQPEFQEILTAGDGEHLLFNVHQQQLPDQEALLFAGFTSDQNYLTLADLETTISSLGPDRAPRGIDPVGWRTDLNATLTEFNQIDQQASTLESKRVKSYATGIIWHDGIAAAIGLVALLLTVLLSVRIGRGLVRELVGLRNSAFELAGVRLPEVMRRLREGDRVDLDTEVPQVPARTGERDEIAQLGRAFNAVQRAAVQAAVEQAELRRGVAAVFVNLARRSQALLHRQLTLLDTMERRTDDPDELEDLFLLDHLTTRMRRHAEGLIILSGVAPGRTWRRPVRVLDVVRAAVGEVEDYARVRVHRMPPVAVVGAAVSDVVHLVAELVENAAVFSPPHTQVRVQGEEVANGFVLEIDDRGLGMGEEALLAANDRLATGGDFDLADSDRLGLFVVSRLSARHGVRVSLRRSPYGGVTAVVLLPRELLATVPSRSGDSSPADSPPVAARELAEETSELALPAFRQRLGRELPRGTGAPGRPTRAGGPRHAAPLPQPASQSASHPGAEEQADRPAEEHTASGLPRRRSLPSRADNYLTVRDAATSRDLTTTRDAATTRELPGRPAAEAPALAPATPLLPRRVRQANLAPALRAAAADDRTSPRAHPSIDETVERSPEEIRATFASFQRGLSRGRAASLPASRPFGPDASSTPQPAAPVGTTSDSSAEGPVS